MNGANYQRIICDRLYTWGVLSISSKRNLIDNNGHKCCNFPLIFSCCTAPDTFAEAESFTFPVLHVLLLTFILSWRCKKVITAYLSTYPSRKVSTDYGYSFQRRLREGIIILPPGQFKIPRLHLVFHRHYSSYRTPPKFLPSKYAAVVLLIPFEICNPLTIWRCAAQPSCRSILCDWASTAHGNFPSLNH